MEDQVLKTGHLQELLELLKPCQNKYRQLYIALGEDDDDLESSNTVVEFYTLVIRKVFSEKIKKEALIKALTSTLVRQGNFARKLEHQLKGIRLTLCGGTREGLEG